MENLATPTRIALHLEPRSNLADAVLRTLAYSDVFDYPLLECEIHRYLIGFQADLSEVRCEISSSVLSGRIDERDGFFALPGRGHLFEQRSKRSIGCSTLWNRAKIYGRRLARLPYVRMVAVTGALAMDNETGRDLDFLIVTTPGRLWLCRGLVMLLVRIARLVGDNLCPNYFISTRALSFPDHNLYTAHELAQMVPLYGIEVYGSIRDFNPWMRSYLPNATGAPGRSVKTESIGERYLHDRLEKLLDARPGDTIEEWEMNRKINRLMALRTPEAEIGFDRDWCKGHFGGYGRKALIAYQQRIEKLGLTTV